MIAYFNLAFNIDRSINISFDIINYHKRKSMISVFVLITKLLLSIEKKYLKYELENRLV